MAETDWRERIRSSRIGSVLVVAITTALIIGGVLLVKGDSSEAAAQSQIELSDEAAARPPAVGEKAPTFSGLDISGSPVDLEDLDRPVWLIFNATWCSACRAEAPHIQKAQLEYGDRVEHVGVGRADLHPHARPHDRDRSRLQDDGSAGPLLHHCRRNSGRHPRRRGLTQADRGRARGPAVVRVALSAADTTGAGFPAPALT